MLTLVAFPLFGGDVFALVVDLHLFRGSDGGVLLCWLVGS